MNEFRKTDVPEIRNPNIENYQSIRPESSMTVKEARAYWDNQFRVEGQVEPRTNEVSRQEVIDGKIHFYDDNGRVYRVDKDLIPNCEYMVNGYEYKTDERGRIVSAKGKLRLKEDEGYAPIKDSIEDIGKGDERETDDRGHIIGNQFDGSDGLENAIPQDAKINRGAYKAFEGTLADEIKAGNDVKVAIEIIYDGDSRRPKEIGVAYSINGDMSIRIFPNSSEKE